VKLKIVSVLMLLAGAVALGLSALPHSAGADSASAAQSSQPEAFLAGTKLSPVRLPPPIKEKDSAKLLVTGRVLSVEGKPLADAEVALAGTWLPQRRGEPSRKEVLAQGKTDKDGHFRLTRAHASLHRFGSLHVLARAKGHGLGWYPVKRLTDSAEAVVRLQPEQVVSGTLVDLQGAPAAGVQLRVFSMIDNDFRNHLHGRTLMEHLDSEAWPDSLRGFRFGEYPGKGVPLWPAAITTDAKGQFQLRGFGRNQSIHLLVEGERFALQELVLQTGTKEPPKPAITVLIPARQLVGCVEDEDTGKPIPQVRLVAQTSVTSSGTPEERLYELMEALSRPRPLNRTETRSDAKGQFQLPLAVGDSVSLHVFAPGGQPYLSLRKVVKLPKGTAKHTVNIALPRGTLVKGKVTQKGSGKPVDQAEIYFQPLRENNPKRRPELLLGDGYPVFSQPDGSYQIVVPPQPGHLLCTITGEDFLRQVINLTELMTGKPGGQDRRFDGRPGTDRHYFHAIVPLNLKDPGPPKDLALVVRRGIMVTGNLLGPDGKKIPRAVMFCGGELLPSQKKVLEFYYALGSHLGGAVPIENGHFELRGCDPEKTYRVFFIEDVGKPGDNPVWAAINTPFALTKDRLGAVLEIGPKEMFGKPLTVKLQAPGTAEVRFLDKKGRPLKRVGGYLGAASWQFWFVDADGKALKQEPYLELIVTPKGKHLGEERVLLALPFQNKGQETPLLPDAEGQLRLTGLIPGAVYRLRGIAEPGSGQVTFEQTFTVQSGQTLKLADVIVAPAK
jgi:hypothetical protein